MPTLDGFTDQDMVAMIQTVHTEADKAKADHAQFLIDRKAWADSAAPVVAEPLRAAKLVYRYTTSDLGLILLLNNGARLRLVNVPGKGWYLSEPDFILNWSCLTDGEPATVAMYIAKRCRKAGTRLHLCVRLFPWWYQ